MNRDRSATSVAEAEDELAAGGPPARAAPLTRVRRRSVAGSTSPRGDRRPDRRVAVLALASTFEPRSAQRKSYDAEVVGRRVPADRAPRPSSRRDVARASCPMITRDLALVGQQLGALGRTTVAVAGDRRRRLEEVGGLGRDAATLRGAAGVVEVDRDDLARSEAVRKRHRYAMTSLRCVALVDVGGLGGHRLAVAAEQHRRLLVPAVWRLGPPERPAAGVVDRPPQRLVLGITGVVIARVQLDAVPVGIAQVDEECVRDAMAPRARARSRADWCAAASWSQARRTPAGSPTQNARWCRRGPLPAVSATSCTVGLRSSQAPVSFSSAPSVEMYSEQRKPELPPERERLVSCRACGS